MAVALNDLAKALTVNDDDLLFVEQNGEAKQISGAVLKQMLATMAGGRGGIESVGKVLTSGVIDVYRITYTDGSTFDYTVTNGKNGVGGVKVNNDEAVRQFLGVAKSYYDARGTKNEPTFSYLQTTCLDSGYDGGNGIDCSTYILLTMMGISAQDSAYAQYLPTGSPSDNPNPDDGGGTGTSDEDGGGETGNYDPSIWKARTDLFGWPVDPREHIAEYENGVYTSVRTAAQLCDYMEHMGQSVDISDGKFLNVRPGDIIFWAKRNPDGSWRKPNRYKHISHVAICLSKRDPGTDADFPEGYPWKHTMLEVTDYSPYCVSRTLEKTYADSVVAVCRPDLGALSGNLVGSVAAEYGITDLNNLFAAGTYYCTSAVTAGLPSGNSGTFFTCEVSVSMTKAGKVYGIIQRLTNCNTNAEYRRVQYCYSHLPAADKWSAWFDYSSGGGGGGGAVDSVNGKTGAVVLTAADVGATTTAQVNKLIDDRLGALDDAITWLEEVAE